MVTFLVLNIIMTIVTAGASIVVTIALAFWNAAVSTTNCVTVENSCVCGSGYTKETYDGKIIEFRYNCVHVRFSYTVWAKLCLQVQLSIETIISIKLCFISWCPSKKSKEWTTEKINLGTLRSCLYINLNFKICQCCEIWDYMCLELNRWILALFAFHMCMQ